MSSTSPWALARKMGVRPPTQEPSLRLKTNAGRGTTVKPGPMAGLLPGSGLSDGGDWGGTALLIFSRKACVIELVPTSNNGRFRLAAEQRAAPALTNSSARI